MLISGRRRPYIVDFLLLPHRSVRPPRERMWGIRQVTHERPAGRTRLEVGNGGADVVLDPGFGTQRIELIKPYFFYYFFLLFFIHIFLLILFLFLIKFLLFFSFIFYIAVL